MNIVEALQSRQHFGGLHDFRDLGTWQHWLVFLKVTYGLPLGTAELGVFRRFTGRQAPRRRGYPEAVVVVGVQSGKSRIAAIVAAFEALQAESGTHALLLGQDHRAL